MKFRLADGSTLNLRDLSNEEYELARRTAPQSLDICPTCGGRDKAVPGSGMKEWESDGYWLNRHKHRCDCQAQLALYARYVLANIGTQYMRLDWDEFAGTTQADEWVRDFVKNWKHFLLHGFGLTFASQRQGVGKTWAATHIGKELIKARQRVYFLDFVQMVDAFCDRERKQDIERRMREPTVLILDDVRSGISERQNDLYALTFEVVVRHRTNFNLPTILTTNLTEPMFEQEFPRIYSLIAHKQMWVNMEGVDYRKLGTTAELTAQMIALGEVRPIT